MSSFEDELLGLVQNLDDALEVKLTAEEVEKQNRQKFLAEFRDLAQNVILPPMRHATQVKSKAVRIEVKEHSDHITLNLAITRDMKQGPDHYSLSYNADWLRKRVHIELRGNVLRTVKISEITEGEVAQQIRDLFKIAGKSGSQ